VVLPSRDRKTRDVYADTARIRGYVSRRDWTGEKIRRDATIPQPSDLDPSGEIRRKGERGRPSVKARQRPDTAAPNTL